MKLIDKKIKTLQGIQEHAVTREGVDVSYDPSLLTEENMLAAIRTLGFRASLQPFERKTMKERLRDIKENRQKYKTEITMVKYAVLLFFVLVAAEAFAYSTIFSDIPGFLERYGWWFLYLDISIVSIGAAVWHYVSYEAKMTCMVGMMIGMTMGMQTGMMLGAVLGATNGFFIGALAGMLLGVIVGTIAGSCCGIMGILEGSMAGIMGGTMGAMISVMMLSDNILWFMPVFIAINVFVLLGLSYMLYEEVVEGKDIVHRKNDFFTFASFCVVTAAILSAIIIYGPKSAIVGGV